MGIDTPFELGTLSAIVGRVGYDGSPGRPAYTATLLLGGVGTRPQRLGPLRASVGVRFGSYRMRFDDPDIDPGLRNENEMIVLGAARLDLSLGGGLSLFGDASTGALLLSTRTRMTFAAAGAAYTMRTPRWLGTLLK